MEIVDEMRSGVVVQQYICPFIKKKSGKKDKKSVQLISDHFIHVNGSKRQKQRLKYCPRTPKSRGKSIMWVKFNWYVDKFLSYD